MSLRCGRALLLGLGLSLGLGRAGAEPGAEDLRNAKALFFDRKYAEARRAWEEVLSSSSGAEADRAAYWVARCSEHLDEPERALREYEAFLARRPADRTLLAEASTSRVGLASRLYRSGLRRYGALLEQALADPDRQVRTFAALQAGQLGGELGRKAAPVLRRIVENESDPDLVDRARLVLIRIDPQWLGSRDYRRAESGRGRTFRLCLYDHRRSEPVLSLNLPMALADLAFGALPEEALKELKREGYDAARFLRRLRDLAPMEILKIEGRDGGRMEIWIE
jgi:tetratricopeptide (TPR) repeat protein